MTMVPRANDTRDRKKEFPACSGRKYKSMEIWAPVGFYIV